MPIKHMEKLARFKLRKKKKTTTDIKSRKPVWGTFVEHSTFVVFPFLSL
jgi:hypothetical protein